MTRKDLGTYHLKVEFDDGRGFIHAINTGKRFTRGTHDFSPLESVLIPPIWESEGDLANTLKFCYLEGEISDQERRLNYMSGAYGEVCTGELRLCALTLIRPDGTEFSIWVGSEGTP
jgi:hypothetical protein